MGSFRDKLSRLPPMGSGPSVDHGGATASPEVGVRTGPLEGLARLEALRARIAKIVGRVEPRAGRVDPSASELPFVRESTERGPLYVRRELAPLGARVGRFPLVAARDADASMLALLALDPAIARCDPRRALYLDTETTGLAGGTGTVPFLIGLAWRDEARDGLMLEQTLLRRLGEEAPALEVVAERLRDASMLVTYNGKSFDWPLLRARFVMNRMPVPPLPPHLDLVHVARRIHGTRLKARTLVAIEAEVLGRERVGDVPGADIVSIYAHYLRTGDDGALAQVVEHNEADVLAMVALVGLYGEPMKALLAEDLVGVAKTLRRAGDLERAQELAEEAVALGGGAPAKKARGDIAKARGDKARALADYEAVLAESREDAAVRLELAKLYEHYVKAPGRALELVESGTGEVDEAARKRRLRLLRKLGRA